MGIINRNRKVFYLRAKMSIMALETQIEEALELYSAGLQNT